MSIQRALVLAAVLAIGAMAACSTHDAASQAAGHPERFFMVNAARTNLSEVETGRLALDRAGSPEVRRYAQMMIDHHTMANQELATLARQKGVTLPDRPDEAHALDAAHLGELQGAQFDKEYMGLMAGEHAKAVSLFQDKARSAADPEVRAYAQRTEKTLEEHLRLAREINGRLVGTGAVR